MKTTILAKLAGFAAAGAVAVGGLSVAGAIPGPFGSNGDGDQSPPEPAQQGQTFAAGMQDWAGCVAEAAPAHDSATDEFDPVAACGERPHPSDFDAVGEPDDEGTLPEPAEQGQAFAAAMQDWAACVSEAAAAREGSDEDAGRFDPFAACGELPHPSDYGIGGPPEWAPGPPPGVPAELPDQATSGQPATVPSGPPAGTPTGPPAEPGPPDGVPTGPPSGVPSGRP